MSENAANRRQPSVASSRLLALALCLALAGCGLVQIGVSNSPDWCQKPGSPACL